LLYDSDFEQGREDCHRAVLKDNAQTQLILNGADNVKMLKDFLNAEQRILIVAGMNKDAATYLLDHSNVISVLNNARPDFAGPLERERVLSALRGRREKTCTFAKSLQDERKKAGAQRQAEAEQTEQEERSRKFKRRILNGIGGAAYVTVNSAVGGGLVVGSAGIAAPVSASLIALSGAVGGAFIGEAISPPG
jgi:hypothetical protein